MPQHLENLICKGEFSRVRKKTVTVEKKYTKNEKSTLKNVIFAKNKKSKKRL